MKKLLVALASLGLVAACGPVQSPECAQYIECQSAVDAEAGTSTADGLDETYGPSGTCWTSTAEVAQGCTDACENAVSAQATAYPDIAACESPE